MNDLLTSFVLGLLFTAGFFFLSFFTVAIIKIVILFIKKDETPKEPKKKKAKAIKSIEINPDEVERIYMKKSS